MSCTSRQEACIILDFDHNHIVRLVRGGGHSKKENGWTRDSCNRKAAKIDFRRLKVGYQPIT
jgi:hypothetical protein